MTIPPSFPRRREPSDFRRTPLGPRLRGDDESFADVVIHQRIRAWSDRELIGAKATLAMTSSEQHGNEVSVLAQVGGHGFNGPSRFAFTMDDALVKEMRITAD